MVRCLLYRFRQVACFFCVVQLLASPAVYQAVLSLIVSKHLFHQKDSVVHSHWICLYASPPHLIILRYHVSMCVC